MEQNLEPELEDPSAEEGFEESAAVQPVSPGLSSSEPREEAPPPASAMPGGLGSKLLLLLIALAFGACVYLFVVNTSL